MESNITPITPAPSAGEAGKAERPEILFPSLGFEGMATFRPIPVCVN